MCKKIARLKYYWTMMMSDCYDFVMKCHQCQIHGNPIHVPPSQLHTLSSPWSFSTWGIDLIGKVNPYSNGHKYIFVAIDYFTKWVEAISTKSFKGKPIVDFIQNHIICRYGVPHEIISHNGSNFIGEETKELLEKYKIKHHLASPYRPQTNGAVEAANKTLVKILKKMIETDTDWSEKLPYALWAYRTSIRTATGATPFLLTYGMEAMHPIKVKIPTLRVLKESQLPEDEWVKVRVARSFNKHVRPRNFNE